LPGAVLEHTTGANPRTIKRILNIVNLLLLILNSQKHKFDDEVTNKAAIVFALVALQNACPEVYAALSRRDSSNVLVPFDEAALEEDPLLKRCQERGKNIDLDAINRVLSLLKGLVGGASDLLVKFIRVSDVAAVKEKAPAEEACQSRFVSAFIRDASEWRATTVQKLMQAVPSASAVKIRGQNAIRLVSPEARDYLCGIWLPKDEEAIRVTFGYFDDKDSAAEYMPKFSKRGVRCEHTAGAGERWLKGEGLRLMLRVTPRTAESTVDSLAETLKWYLLEDPKEEQEQDAE